MSFTTVDIGFSEKRYSFDGPDFGSGGDLGEFSLADLEKILDRDETMGESDDDGPDSIGGEDGDMPDAIGDDEDEEEDDDTESERAHSPA
jgi:hypothetical protein